MKATFSLLFLILFQFVYSQKINTDSLLVVTNNYIKNGNLNEAKKIAHKCIKVAPKYLDFHLSLGIIHKREKTIDSAKYYFQHIIDNNTAYKDSFLLLSKTQLENNELDKALTTIEKGITIHNNEEEFELLKVRILQGKNIPSDVIDYLTDLTSKYPNNNYLKNLLRVEKGNLSTNKIGLNYNITLFSRDNYGPWHLTSLQYNKQIKKNSYIARISYVNRLANSKTTNSGLFYEVESYFKTTQKSYSFANVGFSNSTAFPKFRLAYSHFLSLGNEFENELGYRFTQRTNNNSHTAIIGLGKYFGSNWINLKSSINFNQNKVYPAFSTTFRHYFETKYDYFSINAGYGTSPDERETLTQFQDRVTLKSYRFGLGYNKLFSQRFITEFNVSFNNQEYYPKKYQNEYNFGINLYYLF